MISAWWLVVAGLSGFGLGFVGSRRRQARAIDALMKARDMADRVMILRLLQAITAGRTPGQRQIMRELAALKAKLGGMANR